MEPTSRRAGCFSDSRGEGEDVVAGVGLNFMDALDGEAGALTELGGGFYGHDAGTGEGVGCGELDLQPVVVLAFFGPDAGHLRTGITVDQGGS